MISFCAFFLIYLGTCIIAFYYCKMSEEYLNDFSLDDRILMALEWPFMLIIRIIVSVMFMLYLMCQDFKWLIGKIKRLKGEGYGN